MFLGIRKKYWLILAVSAAIMGVMAFFDFAPFFAARHITVEGPFADRLGDGLDISRQGAISVFRYDRAALARDMLASKHIENVRVSLDLPHSIIAAVNQFRPEALVLSDALYGIDRYSRLLPYDSSWEHIDLPILTGLDCGRIYTAPRDFRVAEVIAGLVEIRGRLPRLYRQIAEIDFSDRVYVIIHLTTGSERYRAHSIDFATQLGKLSAVVNSGTRSDDGYYNLTYDGVVIKEQ